MNALLIWFAILVALTIFFVCAAFYWWRRSHRVQSEQWWSDVLPTGALSTEFLPQPRSAIEASPRRNVSESLRQWLDEAGVASTPVQLLANFGMTILPLGLLIALLSESFWAGALTTATGFAAVSVTLSWRREKRIKQIQQELPRAFDLIAFSLRAGQSLEEALQTAAHEVVDPLAGDLVRVTEEIALGRPVDVALEHWRQRWPTVGGIQPFVEAITVLRTTGGNIIEVIERIVEVIRAQAAYTAKHRALTAEGRMSAIILLALPLVALTMQVVVWPHNARLLFSDTQGQVLVMLAFLLWVFGAFWALQLARGRNEGTS